MSLTVGNFTLSISGDRISVVGPARYMREQGNARLEQIAAGKDVVANYAWQQGTNRNLFDAVLVSLQTDYAAWLGMQRFRQEFQQSRQVTSADERG